MQLQDLFPLLPQDYVYLFQELFIQCYRFAIGNPFVAGTLVVSVWLLTTIFYSIRIGILRSRLRMQTKTAQETQTALDAAREQNQQLQADIGVHLQQVELEQQRGMALQERIAELGGQMAEGIVALASRPELGQQGLSVTPDLQPEHLWQRFHAAVKHLGEKLVAEQKTSGELQQAVSEEAAKLAEKNLQMQALQFRFDSQKQQLARLEAGMEEQRQQLAQQQEALQTQLAELEKRGQQQNAVVAAEQAAQSAMTQPAEPAAAAETVSLTQEKQAAMPQTLAETVSEPAETSAPAPEIANRQKPQPAPAEATAQAAKSGLGGKFKTMLGGSASKKAAKPGRWAAEAPLPPAETAAAAPEQTLGGQPAPAAEDQPKSAVAAGGMFGDVRRKIAKIDAMFGMGPAAPATETVPKPEPEPAAETAASGAGVEVAGGPVAETADKPARSRGFKIPFGSGKKPAAEQPETVAQNAAEKHGGGQLKGLLGKFKRKG
ncbi:MAG: hypothetical protein PHW13_00840 [Methylococcales bacterium]|nr:hypothetical protein [Methylococcales bacterium]